ncbi:TRAP transporter large permease subunit [Dehalococcoidia bacterium]|nr:TRAP transporter large permease subunit [Dehalococcoidia bacterium]
MIDLSPEIITVIMMGGLLVGILTGLPLAYVFGFVAIVVGYTVWGDRVFDVIYMRIFDIMIDYILLAVPLFIFMGIMLERSGIAGRMYDALYLWFGGFRGGLAITTVLIGTIMAAGVGIIAAAIAMLSVVAIPSMLKQGYSKSLVSASVCVSGTLGIFIPPSIMLVVYGPMAGISVGKLFFGAIIPGLILSGLYVIYIALRCFFQPEIAPALPPEEIRKFSFGRKTIKLLAAVGPTAVLIFSVLGVIFFGIAPPTEAAGIGAFVASLLTIAYGKFSFKVLKEVALETMKACGYIFLLLSLAVSFTSVFIGAGGGRVVEEVIMGAPGGRWGIFAIIMLILFLLGKFIDWIGIVFIMVPIITPIGEALGFDPVWFAIMVCLNLQMSFITPPVALAIFYTKGMCTPESGVTMGDIIRGVFPFVGLMAIALVLCVVFPELILWLPDLMIK